MADMHSLAGTDDVARLVAQSPDAVIYADREGIIKLWNDAATRIFGFTAEEALGKDLNIIIPERFQDQHWTGYDRALEAKATKYVGQALATRSQRKDGTAIYIEMSFAIILDDAGEATGALCHARDITERFNSDKELRRELGTLKQRVKELEGTP